MAPDGIAQAMIFATGVFVGGGVVLGAAMVTALARWSLSRLCSMNHALSRSMTVSA